MSIDGQRAISQTGVAVRGRSEIVRNFLISTTVYALQEVGRVVPPTGGKPARRDATVNPGKIASLREPELPLIRDVVALRSEHEFMDAIAELYRLKHVMLHGLYRGVAGGGRNIQPEIPKKICVPRISGILAVLPIEKTVVVFTATGQNEM